MNPSEKQVATIVAVVSLTILLSAGGLFFLWFLWTAFHWWSLAVVSTIVLIFSLAWALSVLGYD